MTKSTQTHLPTQIHQIMGQMDINLINAYINWVLTGYLIRPSIISTNYLYSAPTKANKRDDLARFEPYTWTCCEEKEGMLVRGIIPLTHANSVITIGGE